MTATGEGVDCCRNQSPDVNREDGAGVVDDEEVVAVDLGGAGGGDFSGGGAGLTGAALVTEPTADPAPVVPCSDRPEMLLIC